MTYVASNVLEAKKTCHFGIIVGPIDHLCCLKCTRSKKTCHFGIIVGPIDHAPPSWTFHHHLLSLDEI